MYLAIIVWDWNLWFNFLEGKLWLNLIFHREWTISHAQQNLTFNSSLPSFHSLVVYCCTWMEIWLWNSVHPFAKGVFCVVLTACTARPAPVPTHVFYLTWSLSVWPPSIPVLRRRKSKSHFSHHSDLNRFLQITSFLFRKREIKSWTWL